MGNLCNMSDFNPSCIRLLLGIMIVQFFIYTAVLFWYFLLVDKGCQRCKKAMREESEKVQTENDTE
jgi:hypothetical protein